MPSRRSELANFTLDAVRQSIDAAAAEYLHCYQLVAALNGGSPIPDFENEFVGFQLRLFDALHPLEDLYRKIKAEQRFLVSKKANLNPAWFKRRMSRLTKYLEAIRETLAVGRAIGDGFAWFFYQHDRELIEQHFKQERVEFLPPKIGRQGERSALQLFLRTGGQLLLSHGITTFLRIGDVSLVDVAEFRVTALGEIKTHPLEGDRLPVSIQWISTDEGAMKRIRDDINARSSGSPRPTAAADTPMPARVSDRLDRQIKRMTSTLKSLGSTPPDRKASFTSKFHHEDIDTLLAKAGSSREFVYEDIGSGLVIGVARTGKNDSLGKILLPSHTPKVEKILGDPALEVRKACVENRDYNSLRIFTLGGRDGLRFSSVSFPLVFWTAKTQTIKEILFGELMVVVFFNPAVLLKLLEDRGFNINVSERGHKTKISKKVDYRTMYIDNIEFYYRLIASDFLRAEAVMAMIEENIRNLPEEGEGRVEMVPRLARFDFRREKAKQQ